MGVRKLLQLRREQAAHRPSVQLHIIILFNNKLSVLLAHSVVITTVFSHINWRHSFDIEFSEVSANCHLTSKVCNLSM